MFFVECEKITLIIIIIINIKLNKNKNNHHLLLKIKKLKIITIYRVSDIINYLIIIKQMQVSYIFFV